MGPPSQAFGFTNRKVSRSKRSASSSTTAQPSSQSNSRKNSPLHGLKEAESAECGVFEGSAELMGQRDRPAGDRFECSELEIELGVDAVDLRGFDERAHQRSHLRASLRA